MGDLQAAPARYDPDQVIALIADRARAKRQKQLLVYIHVPFCTSKCHFCDWVTRYPTTTLTATGAPHAEYVDALCAQIRWYGPRLRELGYEVGTVYWGGGTPTRLQPAQLAAVAEALNESLDTSRVREHTVECSPETLTAEKLEVLRQGGANRISLGVQSFAPDVLRRMGRAHDPETARRAIALVRASGPRNLNIDLIIGYADQAVEASVESVEEAIALDIPHLSVYLFRSFDPTLISVKQVREGFRSLDVERAAEALDLVQRTLASAGYEQYAIASYAREPRFHFDGDQHYYTHRGDYIGFGAGAESFLGHHSILQSAPGGTIDLRDYCRDPLSMGVVRPANRLAATGAAYIRLLQAMSTRTGISYDAWSDHLGIDAGVLRNAPALLRALRRLEAAGGTIVESPDGVRLDPATAAAAINRVQIEELAAAPVRV